MHTPSDLCFPLWLQCPSWRSDTADCPRGPFPSWCHFDFFTEPCRETLRVALVVWRAEGRRVEELSSAGHSLPLSQASGGFTVGGLGRSWIAPTSPYAFLKFPSRLQPCLRFSTKMGLFHILVLNSTCPSTFMWMEQAFTKTLRIPQRRQSKLWPVPADLEGRSIPMPVAPQAERQGKFGGLCTPQLVSV